MDNLAQTIKDLQADFQHVADFHPWICMAAPSFLAGFKPLEIGEATGHPQCLPLTRKPDDRRLRPVVEHVQELTHQANAMLMSALDGQHRIPDDIAEDIREFDTRCPGHGWLRWLWFSTVHAGVVRCENYPQVAATALRVLRDHCRQDGGTSPDVASPASSSGDKILLPTFYSAPDIARRLDQPIPRVESFLRSLREKLPDCFEEVPAPRKDEPKYLYRTAVVWPEIQKRLPRWQSLSTDD